MNQFWYTIILAFFAVLGCAYSGAMVVYYNRLVTKYEEQIQINKTLRKEQNKIVAMLRHPASSNHNENIFDKFAELPRQPYDWQKDN
jgi:Tfp pilus assembly protein PilO